MSSPAGWEAELRRMLVRGTVRRLHETLVAP